MHLLFICTANISRSFLAEMLLRHAVKEGDLKDITASSAGTHAVSGYPPDAKMVEYLRHRNIEASEHASRRVQPEDIDGADWIFVMEKRQAAEIIRERPQAAAKVKLLGGFVSSDSAADDIIDPYGRSPYHYRLAQSQISLAIERIVQNRRQLQPESLQKKGSLHVDRKGKAGQPDPPGN